MEIHISGLGTFLIIMGLMLMAIQGIIDFLHWLYKKLKRSPKSSQLNLFDKEKK